MDKNKKFPTTKQAELFVQTAKELGCDESEAAFTEKLKKLAKQQPEQPKKGKPNG